jgi:peptidoglycan/LPS O-acetylase OafA/YrhL
LIHLPAYFVVRDLLTHPLSGLPPLTREWVIGLTTVVAAWTFAALSWRYFESPMLGYKHQFEALVLPHSPPEAQWINSDPDFLNTQ